MDSMIARGMDTSVLGPVATDPRLLHLLGRPEDQLTTEELDLVADYKEAHDEEMRTRAAMEARMRELEDDLEFEGQLATGGINIAMLPSMTSGVEAHLDATNRDFRSVEDMRKEASAEVVAAQIAATKASTTVAKAEQELDVTSYWLNAVDDKVSAEVKEARKAANRLRKATKKPKGSPDKAAWLKGTDLETRDEEREPLTPTRSSSRVSPFGPDDFSDLSVPSMGVGITSSPIQSLRPSSAERESLSLLEYDGPADEETGRPPARPREVWTPPEKKKSGGGGLFSWTHD